MTDTFYDPVPYTWPSPPPDHTAPVVQNYPVLGNRYVGGGMTSCWIVEASPIEDAIRLVQEGQRLVRSVEFAVGATAALLLLTIFGAYVFDTAASAATRLLWHWTARLNAATEWKRRRSTR